MLHTDPEKVAYWYFRLNGFLQIENFIVHPTNHGSQRTDADLIAVRFPHRAERLVDRPTDIMRDDEQGLSLCKLIDLVIAEVKTNQPCSLNGPWTNRSSQNIPRVLAAIGCLPPEQISQAAEDLYSYGFHSGDTLRLRFVALGQCRNDDLAKVYPEVTQLIWSQMLEFIWTRFRAYRRQKTQVDQWDTTGRRIKSLADSSANLEDFVKTALDSMGIRNGSQSVIPI